MKKFHTKKNGLITMFKQQIIGTFNLSIPLLVLAWIYPSLFQTVFGVVSCSILMGLYILYLNYKATKNYAVVFTYIPSGTYKEVFEESIRVCKVDPQTIHLRYGNTNEQLAVAVFSTIIIDPLLWQGITEDPVALQVKNILDVHTVPLLTDVQKTRIAMIHDLFSLPAQRFIFKHELGHVFHRYSTKKLAIIGLIGACATYAGISTAIALQSMGALAILIGIFVGGLTDLLLSYASNVVFKSYEEKRADRFAACYSTQEEIEAAADFFERHHEVCVTHQGPQNILTKLPSIIVSGHLSGKARADYIRACRRK